MINEKWHVEVRVALLSQLCFELQMPASPSDSMMSESPQRLQIISTEPTTTPQRIQVHGQHHLSLCVPVLKPHQSMSMFALMSFISDTQIVTDQQTGQKIQIVTAMKPPPVPKQQFILTTADSAGSGKVLLTSSDTHNTKQLIFTAADSLMPGRIQVLTTPPSTRSI